MGLVNGHDNVYGDAMLSSSRIAEVTASEAKNVFFNRTHDQSFSNQELARSDIYDGYNMKHPHVHRTLPLEHSWRATLAAPQSPLLPEGAVARRSIHGKASVRREEMAQPYARHPHMHNAVEQICTSNLPKLQHVDTHRGDTAACAAELATGVGNSSVGGARTAPRSQERVPPKPELPAVTLSGGVSTDAVSCRTNFDMQPTERQGVQPAPSAQHSHLEGDRAREATTREGGDVVRVEQDTSGAAPTVNSTRVRQTMANVQRVGGDDYQVRRLKDHGAPHVAARRALPASGARALSEDDVRMTELLHPQATVSARAAHAVHRAGGTDAVAVENTAVENTRGAANVHTVPTRPCEDSPRPERAELKQGVLRGGTSVVPGQRVLRISEDRPPTCDEATWRFGVGQGMISSTVVRPSEDALGTSRSNAAPDAGGGAADATTAAHRPLATTSAQGGKFFGPDRLMPAHQTERTQIEKRIHAAQTTRSQRSTPVSALYGAEPSLNQRASIGSVDVAGRETPVRWSAGDASYLS